MKTTHKTLLAFALGILLMSGMGAVVSRITTFTDGSVLTAADLNSEFNNLVDNVNALSDVNITDSAAIDPKKISSTIAGTAITRDGSTGVLAVGVDNSSIETSGDTIQVKALGITAAKLAGDSVNTSKIENESVFAVDLAPSAVQTAKIQDLAVTTAKINDSAVTEAKMAANSISSGAIIAGAINTSDIGDSAVTSVKIAGDTITAANISAGAIESSELASNAVTTAKITDGNVTQVKLGGSNCSQSSTVSGSTSSTSFSTIASVSLTQQNGSRATLVQVNNGGNGTTTFGILENLYIRVLINGSGSTAGGMAIGASSPASAFSHVDLSGTGGTFALQVRAISGTANYGPLVLTVCEL